MNQNVYQRRALLIIQDDGETYEYPLNENFYLIGRVANCHIRITSSPMISRYHATLIKMGIDSICYYEIIDGIPKGKPSSNGFSVNGHIIRAAQVHRLYDQDLIVFTPKIYARYYDSFRYWDYCQDLRMNPFSYWNNCQDPE